VDIVTGIIEKVATNWQLNLVMAGLTALSWLISGFVFYYMVVKGDNNEK
jgi:hypothetical protein